MTTTTENAILRRDEFGDDDSYGSGYAEYLYAHPDVPYNSFNEFLQYVDIMSERATAINKQKLILRINKGVADSQLFTISFDQQLEAKPVVAAMDKIMEEIISANYVWMKNAVYCYEFYSGRDSKWNPHVHIAVNSVGLAPSKMVANIKCKIKAKKLENVIYNVNCTVAKSSGSRHLDYVRGSKTESKDKNIQLDNSVRKDLKIKEYYEI